MRRLSHLSFILVLASSVTGFSTIRPQTQPTNGLHSPTWVGMVSPKTEDTEGTLVPNDKAISSVLNEANDALANVGWAPPREDGEMTSDDPFVREIDAGIQRDFGVGLEELLNPAKVVNLERDLYNLRIALAEATGVTLESTVGLTTQVCDGGGGGVTADEIRTKIDKKEKDLLIERRSVFRGWLKNVFLLQAILSFGLSWVMATNPEILFGQFGWFQTYNMYVRRCAIIYAYIRLWWQHTGMNPQSSSLLQFTHSCRDISIKVLGYWWWWLFVVPSLRSRRPKGAEKKALDIAFLGTPIISLLAPVATKDTAIIWAANFAVVAASYAFAFATNDDADDADGDDSKTPEWLKFVYKSLDFGSGRERGARN